MATSNKQMGDMLRKRRDEMSDLPAYEGPPAKDASVSVEVETDATTPPTEPNAEGDSAALKVNAPGEPSTGSGFEYEPVTDVPGAWIVYPPGVPCDDTEYRVTMSKPAAEADFPKMQKAIEDAGGTVADPGAVGASASPVSDVGSATEGVY